MSLNPKRLAGAALLVLCSGSAAAAAETILPGYWESTNSLLLVSSTSRKCLTADQVQAFISGPSNRHYTCTYVHRRVAGGHVSLKGSCVDRKGRGGEIAITGSYTPTEFHLKGTLVPHGIPLPIPASTDARRISAECPADLPPGK